MAIELSWWDTAQQSERWVPSRASNTVFSRNACLGRALRREGLMSSVVNGSLTAPHRVSRREEIIESRHSMKSLEGMGSSSQDLGAELKMHSFTLNCDTLSNEKKVTAVVPETSVEVTCSEAMLALSFSTLLVKCLMKILVRSALG